MILVGDCRERLRELPERSVQTCVTSPPYFGLRSYSGGAAEIGTEPTPDEFVAALVAVFREVRRVLRDDGTVWLNLGDSYAAARSYQVASSKGGPKHAPAQGFEGSAMSVPAGMKAKDLIGIPWMVAFALRADGWYLRSDIIWAKPNPMPESVTDRPTKAHEYLFLLSKGPRYFYDADAIRERGVEPERQRADRIGGANGHTVRHSEGAVMGASADRNKRSVWTVATQPYAGAHFATFPPKLIEPCVLAGSPPKCCGECGAPWTRVKAFRELLGLSRADHEYASPEAVIAGAVTGGPMGHYRKHGANLGRPLPETLGWEPTCTHPCECDTGKRTPLNCWNCTGRGEDTGRSVVLDPFAGAGTVGVVCGWHGREYIGVELNPEYAAMAEKRIALEGRPGGKPENHEHPNVHDDQLGFEVAS